MNVFCLGFCSLFLLANTAAWLGAPRLLNRHAYLASYLTGFTIMTGYWALLYLVWTPLLGLPYPPPLLGAQACVLGARTNTKIKTYLGSKCHYWFNLFLFVSIVPIPECLALGCSGGGGSCGWSHLVPVPSLLAG